MKTPYDVMKYWKDSSKRNFYRTGERRISRYPSSVVIEFDSWKDGRTLKDMGIDGLTKEQFKEYMKTGKRP